MQSIFKVLSKKQIKLVWFIYLSVVFNLLAFQGPLLRYTLGVSALPEIQGLVQIVSIQILQITLLATLLFTLSFISMILMRIVLAVIFTINAAALYFMVTYAMEIDLSMISNIFNTDSREATELWHISAVPFMFGLGVVPSVLVLFIPIKAPKRIFRLVGAVSPIIALGAWLAATSYTFLWYDQHASRMGSKILPWSYIVNTGRYFNRSVMNGREQVLLPDAAFVDPNPTQKQIVVLVIGEALRADNVALLGYDRDTSPNTQGLDIAAFPIGEACATNTIASTACILTHEGRVASSRTTFEPLPSYLKRHGVYTIFRSNNSGTPPLDVDEYARAADLFDACTGENCPDKIHDGVLNLELADQLTRLDQNRIFVALHQAGSHGPAYYTKYPPEFGHFQPVCETVQVAECSYEELVNAYDNTVRYTDSLIADLVEQLQTVPNAVSTLIFVSDHGQSLGENGFYLHGAPMVIAPPEQRRVPFLVWMSEGFKGKRGLTNAAILRPETFPHDFPFHSIMGAFGMSSDIYKPEFDIFNSLGNEN